MLDMLNAVWRPFTVALMALPPLLIGLGLAPPSLVEHMDRLLTLCGSVIVALAALRAWQQTAHAKAEASKAEANAKAAELLPLELRAAAADPQLLDALADGVVARLRDRGLP